MWKRNMWKGLLLAPLAGASVIARQQDRDAVQQCPGYKATNVHEEAHSLTADLTLAGEACNVYGSDVEHLKLLVEYQTDKRLHVIIQDANEQVYQVPESVLPRPKDTGDGTREASALKFDYKTDPFTFTVTKDDEVLFDTSASALVFESQYLGLRTWLPNDPYLYGMGEHSDSLRMPTTNYTRTLWNRDSPGAPNGTNIYGSHPVYYDHRGDKGTHGVFLLNSNGMDVKLDKTSQGKQYLQYNALGGVLDFYFFTGDTPKDVSAQYAEIVGLPAMQSYWTFGFHNCKYGYRDIYETAEVVRNYSAAGIPLETMWNDIDYMDGRRVFTNDPERYPLSKVRELVDYLHKHDQHYIVMVDPAVSVSNNSAYKNGVEKDIFLKTENGSIYEGAVWPGVTAFPDWFHPDIQDYWDDEFSSFFNASTGVDIDGLWIDMNEAANMCPYPCKNPAQYSEENDLPPEPPAVRPSSPRPLPGFPADFQPSSNSKRDAGQNKIGLPGRELIDPPYKIQNAAGALSQKTINTDLVHAGGYVEYDTHNLYGTMMGAVSRKTMQQRRPESRPFIITRSTYAGAGAHVGHWLGDNLSKWHSYRESIQQIMSFASLFQVPMVGADVCGFSDNTTVELCARWAALGSFYTFYRNHNDLDYSPQEFYHWPEVAESARKAIDTRYRLLDYTYTAFHRQSKTGEPFLQPLFYLYPTDSSTFANDRQFFFGDALLISPVTEESSTSVDAYFPDDVFYDWYTGKQVRGRGANITLEDIDITHIPVHVRGGNVLPVRASNASTTTELRTRGFELLIAPGLDETATGSLYLDDGDSVDPEKTSEITFAYRDGTLHIDGSFDYGQGVVEGITLLGQEKTATHIVLDKPTTVKV